MKDFIYLFQGGIHTLLFSPFLAFVVAFFLSNIIFIEIYFLARYVLAKYCSSQFSQLTRILFKNLKIPSLLLSILLSFRLALGVMHRLYLQINAQNYPFMLAILIDLITFASFAALFWLIFRILSNVQALIHTHIDMEKYSLGMFLFSLISNGIKAAIILLVANMLIPWLGLTAFLQLILEKLSRILLISVFGWIFLQIINGGAKLLLSQYEKKQKDELTVRKVKTQVILLKRIILTIGGFIIGAAILLVFDSVKHLGVGLLTTAGVISAIGAVASQHSLSRLAAGLQMALTQPIRIGDTVTVDNEFGVIEEISLSYVVVKLWDLRRLILPIDYLNTKGFHNLSRTSSQLLDTVFLYVDFTFPVEVIRKKFFELIEQSPFWDHEVKVLHVTALTPTSMELRALMSAKNSGDLWELQCEMREKLMEFIVKHYEKYLPIQRKTNKGENRL